MFPVVSLLRRAASHAVYVEPRQLVSKDGRYFVRIARRTRWGDLETGRWAEETDLVPMSTLSCRAASSSSAAIKLTKKENELAEKLDLAKQLFTLVVGHEVENGEGPVTRTVHLAVVRGVFGFPKPDVLPVVAAKARRVLLTRRLPPGAREP